MAEAMATNDLEGCTWGDLKQRLNEEPGLWDQLASSSIGTALKMLKDPIPHRPWLPELRFPLLAEELATGPTKPIFSRFDNGDRLTCTPGKAPSPGDVERVRMRMLEAVVVREVALLKAKITELTALLREPSLSGEVSHRPVDERRIGIGDDVLAPAVTGNESPAAALPAAKRAAGRPTRKREILQLLTERWALGTVAVDSLAEEARRIEKALHVRCRMGIQAGEPPIPQAKTIETIIRKRYARLMRIRNAVKYFRGPSPN